MIRLHVLFADGDAVTRAIFARSLEPDSFFIVRSCASGGEALKTAREWRPDLALLDMRMPGLDGSVFLARLRVDKRTAAIPVVFVTGRGQGEERAHFRARGAAGVIEKPFDPVGLAAELRRFVPLEGALRPARETFLLRLDADARALSSCRQWLLRGDSEPVLARINEIAHALAGAGGTYGFAGITCESAALSVAVENYLAGRASKSELVKAVNRLLMRIGFVDRAVPRARAVRERRLGQRYSAATA